jgi:arylsulfatase
VLGVEFAKESQTPAETTGTFSMFIGETKVATLAGARTQNGKFNLCGEGLNIGRDGGAPVTLDYPGERPWAFTGGTIQRVVVDVSGEPYLDLEKEAIGMMKRD